MTGRRATAIACCLLVVSFAEHAAADPTPAPAPTPASMAQPMPSGHLRLTTGPGLLTAPSGALITLPQGSHVLDAPTWDKVDTETKRLQDAEVRLTAENTSLRASMSSWRPGWYVVATAIATGLALGWYAHSKI